MLSPVTFTGVANATAAVGQPASPHVGEGRGQVGRQLMGRAQPVRVLSTQPAPPFIPLTGVKPPVAISPQTPSAPPRNLPRGSLLDLSV
jgi:hypothetical protein